MARNRGAFSLSRRAAFEDARPLNSQKLPGRPRAFPAIEKDSRSRHVGRL